MVDLENQGRRGQRTTTSARRRAEGGRGAGRGQPDVVVGQAGPSGHSGEGGSKSSRGTTVIRLRSGQSSASAEYETEIQRLLEDPPSPHSSNDIPVSGDTAGQQGPGDVPSSSSTVLLRRGGDGRFARQSEASEGTSLAAARKRSRGRRDNSWTLREAAPGGPTYPSVIPSFTGHVAFRLFSESSFSRPVLTGHTRYGVLDRLRVGESYTQDVLHVLATTGLSDLDRCTLRRLDMPLLSAFIERWQPDTNTFHMPFGEMTILLHDVERILGIPITGRACAVSSAALSSPADGMCELFKMTQEEVSLLLGTDGPPICRGSGVLNDDILILTGNRHDPVVRAQGYLMLLLGSTLFVDKSGFMVRSYLYDFVRDMTQVSGYAWGAGALAYLYRQLGVASRLDSKGVAGCLSLLQIWIYEYFPMFRPSVAASIPVAAGQPRAAVYSCLPRFDNTDQMLRSYRQRLDALTASSPSWTPYGPDMHVAHPRTIWFAFLRLADIVEPYQPDRCLRQLGYRQIIPLSMPPPSYHYRTGSSQTYRLEYGVCADHPWNTWQAHVSGITMSVPATTHAEVSPDYMDWYLAHSHPYICPHRPTVIPDAVQCLVEIGSALVSFADEIYDLSPEEQFTQFQRFVAEHESTLRGRGGRARRSRVGRGGVAAVGGDAAEGGAVSDDGTGPSTSQRGRGAGRRGGGGGRRRGGGVSGTLVHGRVRDEAA